MSNCLDQESTAPSVEPIEKEEQIQTLYNCTNVPEQKLVTPHTDAVPSSIESLPLLLSINTQNTVNTQHIPADINIVSCIDELPPQQIVYEEKNQLVSNLTPSNGDMMTDNDDTILDIQESKYDTIVYKDETVLKTTSSSSPSLLSLSLDALELTQGYIPDINYLQNLQTNTTDDTIKQTDREPIINNINMDRIYNNYMDDVLLTSSHDDNNNNNNKQMIYNDKLLKWEKDEYYQQLLLTNNTKLQHEYMTEDILATQDDNETANDIQMKMNNESFYDADTKIGTGYDISTMTTNDTNDNNISDDKIQLDREILQPGFYDPYANEDPITRSLHRMNTANYARATDEYIKKRIAHCQQRYKVCSRYMSSITDVEQNVLKMELRLAYMEAETLGSRAMTEDGINRDHFALITTEVFLVTIYLNTVLFEKLLQYQLVWHTYPSIATLQEIQTLVYPSTILRFYNTILIELDAEARLFFISLPMIPPTAPYLSPIPQSVLKKFFVSTEQYKEEQIRLENKFKGVNNCNEKDEEKNTDSTNNINLCNTNTIDRNIIISDNSNVNEKNIKKEEIQQPGFVDEQRRDIEFEEPLFNKDPKCLQSKYLLRTFLVREDFFNLLNDILMIHPGLEFLSQSPEFQKRYAQTVIARIFYTINIRGDERLTLRELRHSDLLLKLSELAIEEDINCIHAYFSYEHFYVIYCKFWELDTDHDMLLTQDDLTRYEDYALTSRILTRIFSQIPRRFLSGTPKEMCYEDFIIFLISEIDKTSKTAISYWFRALDQDGDDKLTTYEISHFFEEQRMRVSLYSVDLMNLNDIICQITDMVSPDELVPVFTKKQLYNSGLFPTICDMLFNLHRYAISESRDVYRIRHQHYTPEQTDWDRWASQCYYILVGADIDEENDFFDQQDTMIDPLDTINTYDKNSITKQQDDFINTNYIKDDLDAKLPGVLLSFNAATTATNTIDSINNIDTTTINTNNTLSNSNTDTNQNFK